MTLKEIYNRLKTFPIVGKILSIIIIIELSVLCLFFTSCGTTTRAITRNNATGTTTTISITTSNNVTPDVSLSPDVQLK